MSWAEIAFRVMGAIVVAVGLFLLEKRRRRRDRLRFDEFVREHEATFPGRCMLCSYVRWGREMGFASAFDPIEPHACHGCNSLLPRAKREAAHV